MILEPRLIIYVESEYDPNIFYDLGLYLYEKDNNIIEN